MKTSDAGVFTAVCTGPRVRSPSPAGGYFHQAIQGRPVSLREKITRCVAGWFPAMPQFHYAYICSSGVCYAVVRLDFRVCREDAIAVDSLDVSIIGKRWTGSLWESRETLRGPGAVIPGSCCMNSDLFHITGGLN